MSEPARQMTPSIYETYSALFSALSDPVRLEMIDQLSKHGEMSVGELSRPFAISAPAISRHLKVLETAGLIERRVDRQWRICSLNLDTLNTAGLWLHEVTGSEAPAHLRIR